MFIALFLLFLLDPGPRVYSECKSSEYKSKNVGPRINSPGPF